MSKRANKAVINRVFGGRRRQRKRPAASDDDVKPTTTRKKAKKTETTTTGDDVYNTAILQTSTSAVKGVERLANTLTDEQLNYDQKLTEAAREVIKTSSVISGNLADVLISDSIGVKSTIGKTLATMFVKAVDSVFKKE